MTISPLDSPSLRLVMFDLDGTLVDSVPSLALAVNQMLVALEREPFAVAEIKRWIGNGSPMLVKRALSGSHEVDASLSESLITDAHQLFLDAYADCAVAGTELYPGVLECLEVLATRDLMLAVVTNKPARFIPEILEGFGMAQYFQILVGGDTCERQKPAADQLELAMQQAQVTPKQALMIGDSSNDILAAKAAGVANVAVSYGYNHGQPVTACQPDRVVDSLTELL